LTPSVKTTSGQPGEVIQVLKRCTDVGARRLFDQDPDQALEKDGFLKQLKEMEGNVKAQQEFLRSPNELKHDFTQYYNPP
jgi:hypothetical protein